MHEGIELKKLSNKKGNKKGSKNDEGGKQKQARSDHPDTCGFTFALAAIKVLDLPWTGKNGKKDNNKGKYQTLSSSPASSPSTSTSNSTSTSTATPTNNHQFIRQHTANRLTGI